MTQNNQLICDLASITSSLPVPESLATAIEKVGKENVDIIANRILSWLKTQYRWNKDRTLPADPHRAWYAALQQLISEHTSFGMLFEFDKQGVRLHRSLTKEQCDEIKSTANKLYTPPLIK